MQSSEEQRNNENDVRCEIAEDFKGHISAFDLIGSTCSMYFSIRYNELTPRFFFKIHSTDYHLEVGCTEDSFYILRNDQFLIKPLKPSSPEGILLFAIYTPTQLKLIVLDHSNRAEINNGDFSNVEVILNTEATFPPNSLIKWARRKTIAPKTTYKSKVEFYEEVASSILSLEDKIANTDMFNAFWDIGYEGRKIVLKRPKKETDVAATIHGLLYDIGLAKNFEIIPEYKTGKGRLDFLISGIIKDRFENVCIEFKHAHSDKLEEGLMVQLPEYMRNNACSFGIYCVLYFKGNLFSEPQKYDHSDLFIYLEGVAMKAGLKHIRIYILNLSHPIPPRKK